MTYGFVGTGTITAAMVEGLRASGDATPILLSPRSAATAARLAASLPGVSVAASNQAVVEGASTVILSIRPQVAEEVTRALRFRPGQTLVSLVAATDLGTLRDWTGLDAIRAVPLPFVAKCRGVTPVCPPEPQVLALFGRLGQAIPCRTAQDFDLLAVTSALMGSYFGILETAQIWAEAQGMAPQTARDYLAGLFASLGAEAQGTAPFARLREEFSTKGGLNEQMFRVFGEEGGTAALDAALTSVLTRVRGQ